MMLICLGLISSFRAADSFSLGDSALVALWGLWVFQAWFCVLQSRRFLRKVQSEPRYADWDYRPPAVVFVPFKGLDAEATANLHGLLRLDYPDFHLVLIVESEEDVAYPFLRDELAKIPTVSADIVVAGEAPDDTGQKVHNLLGGVAFAERMLGEGRWQDPAELVWVFADSDAIPGSDWLRDLVRPLVRADKTAVTTGYRWFVPPRGPVKKFRLGGRLASVINAGIATFAEHARFRFAWGGSMAMRRTTAMEGGLLGLWRGSLSDDYQVTRMCRALRRSRASRPEHGDPGPAKAVLVYVPECLVESPVNFKFNDLVEFARRQYRITRVYEPGFFWRAFLVLGLYVGAWVSSLWLLGLGVIRGFESMALIAAFALLAVALANQLRSASRRKTIQKLFGNGTYERLIDVHRWDRYGTSVWIALNFLLMASASFGRSIAWRGKRYRMRGPQRIQRIR